MIRYKTTNRLIGEIRLRAITVKDLVGLAESPPKT